MAVTQPLQARDMLHSIDVAVLVGYLAAIVLIGLWCGRGRTTADVFMAGGRSLPGWAVGLSMFGSYISSISFLGNPGKSYDGNWNAFVFSLATPLATLIAVRWFMPFYRGLGCVSAYEHLEHRFGLWARTYAVVCYLLTQWARAAVVIYLLALAAAPMTGWSKESTIMLTGFVTTAYTLTGGLKAVVWTGVIQSAVLVAGTALCLITVIAKAPGGLVGVVEYGVAAEKFSLGSLAPSFVEPTVWVMLLFGMATHLGNFGADQGFVQRYISAHDERQAAQSLWITTWLYVPVAGVFFFIGTALAAFYSGRPDPLGMPARADDVFPHFIATQLPVGAGGLVVAAIFAASLDSNLNSMATLTLCDLYKRWLRPMAGDVESLRVLRGSTVAWGAVSTALALSLTHFGGTALDVWWKLAGLFSGGVLGLFLLGFCSRRADGAAAAVGAIVGLATIAWMTLPEFTDYALIPPGFRSPFHANMTMVVTTLAIFLSGTAMAALRPRRPPERS